MAQGIGDFPPYHSSTILCYVCSGYRLEDVFMYFVFGYTHDFCHLSIFIPFVSNMSCIFVDNGQVGMAQNDHFWAHWCPISSRWLKRGGRCSWTATNPWTLLERPSMMPSLMRPPPWRLSSQCPGRSLLWGFGKDSIRSLTAWLSQTMWRTWCLGFIILILILIINIILHYPPTPCQRLGAWGLLPGWFLRLTCLTFLKRCQLLRRVPMQPQAQRPDVRLIGAQKAKIIRILG